MKKFLLSIVSAASVLAMASCDGGSTGSGNGSTSNPLTPEENRARLEQIGLDAVNMASPDRQIELLEAIDKFFEYISEYELDFRDDTYVPGSSYRAVNPVQPMSALMSAAQSLAETGNPYVLSRAVQEDSYIYEASRLYGIYEFTGNAWKYTASDSELTFIYPCDGKEIRATVSGSGREYSYEYTSEWSEPGYSTPSGDYVPGDTYIDYYTIVIPAKVVASITSGSDPLFSLEVDGEYDEGSRVNQTLSLVAGSYDVDMSLDVSNSNISQNMTFDIDGTRFISSAVSVSGTGLCDVDSYQENVENMFSDATVKVSVLDLNVEARSNGNISRFINDYIDMDDEAYAWDDDPAVLEPESSLPPTWASEEYIARLSELINSNLAVSASYGANEPFADFIAKPMYSRDLYFSDEYIYRDDWGNTYPRYEYRNFSGYEVSYIIKFRNDGAEFEITDFFNEDDYASVVDAAESLADRYEYYLDYLFNY